MAILVLDKKKQPLMPCSEKRARLLLERGRAVVVRIYPFTIRLKDRVGGGTQTVRVKIDPGSKATGIAWVREAETIDTETGEVETKITGLLLMELTHRGQAIRNALEQRLAFRRPRRGQLRYRLMREKQVHGFKTGDAVRAEVPKGKKAGIYVGRVAVRASGSFNIQTPNGSVQGINHNHCILIQRADGYGYAIQPKIAPTQTEEAR